MALEVASGRSDKEIAGSLGLSLATVRTYVRRIYATLGVRNRVELSLALGALSEPRKR